jgi:PAS domain S-box-containing protein
VGAVPSFRAGSPPTGPRRPERSGFHVPYNVSADRPLVGSESVFRAMLDAAPDAMVAVDRDGRIVMANIQTEALFGYSTADLIGEHVEILVPRHARAVHPADREKYFRRPKTRPMGAGLDLAGRRADGTEFPAEISLSSIEMGEGILALAAIRDVTDRKQAEARVQARVQAMLDAAPDAMVGVGPDGVIVMANIQTEALFGYERSELLGRSVELLLPEGVGDIRPSRQENAGGPGTPPSTVELALAGRRLDGSEFPAEISVSSIETEEGLLALAAVRDISDRKRAAVEMQEARDAADRASAELRRTNKELEAFSYAVAHDLRAPLRVIDGFCQALDEDHGETLDESARGYLDRVRRNVQWMADMIDGLLGLSRLVRSPLDLTDVDLSAVAEETTATLRAAAPDRRFELVVEEGICAHADTQLVRMLIGNLVENAWKFTAPHERARIEFGVMEGEDRRVFFVRDDGVGFDTRYADKLFAPFQRLHRAEDFPGTGIGLATVERIVRRHGGEIWGESELGSGATFYFTLEAGP